MSATLVSDGLDEQIFGAIEQVQGRRLSAASKNKSLAQMNKSPDPPSATKRYRPEGDAGEAKNKHTSPTTAE